MRKRMLLILLALVLVLPAGFATGAQEGKAAGTGKLAPATVTFYFPGETKKDTRMVLDEIEKRTADTLNMKLEFNFVPWGDYVNKINVLTASGDKYDAHFDADWWDFPFLSQKGALKDISDIFPKVAPRLYAQFDKATLDAVRVNGKLYSIPWRFPKTDRRVVRVREDLKKKYGVPDINDVNGLEAYLKAVKDNEPDMVPFIPATTMGMFVDAAGYFAAVPVLELVIAWDDSKLKIVPWEQTSAFRTFTQLMQRWYSLGYIPKDVLTQNYGDLPVATGKVAAQIDLWEDAPLMDAKLKAINPDWAYKVYVIYPDKVSTKSPPSNNMMAFNANGGQTERALMFMQWVQDSQENYDLLMYGIKGVHYTLDDKGALAYPAGMNADNHPYQGWLGQWAFWNLTYYRFPDYYPSSYRQDALDFVNRNNRYAPTLGFSPSFDLIKTEVAQRQSLIAETGKPLSYGLLTPDKIDEYIQKQKDAGTDKIVAEIQKQLDAWVAKR